MKFEKSKVLLLECGREIHCKELLQCHAYAGAFLGILGFDPMVWLAKEGRRMRSMTDFRLQLLRGGACAATCCAAGHGKIVSRRNERLGRRPVPLASSTSTLGLKSGKPNRNRWFGSKMQANGILRGDDLEGDDLASTDQNF